MTECHSSLTFLNLVVCLNVSVSQKNKNKKRYNKYLILIQTEHCKFVKVLMLKRFLYILDYFFGPVWKIKNKSSSFFIALKTSCHMYTRHLIVSSYFLHVVHVNIKKSLKNVLVTSRPSCNCRLHVLVHFTSIM